ncbi:hypothetical protein BH10BAC1_BH10BAC1_11050 [soil metagenome]
MLKPNENDRSANYFTAYGFSSRHTATYPAVKGSITLSKETFEPFIPWDGAIKPDSEQYNWSDLLT